MERSIGERAGKPLTDVLLRIWKVLGSFIRTQALVSPVDATFIGAGLLILGVPLAFPLIVLTFFGGFIPIVGAFVAGAIAVLVALVTKGLTTALIVLIIIIVVQQLEGNVLQPVLQSRSMNLHAAVVLLAVSAGRASTASPAHSWPYRCLGRLRDMALPGRADECSSAGRRTGRTVTDRTPCPVIPRRARGSTSLIWDESARRRRFRPCLEVDPEGVRRR